MRFRFYEYSRIGTSTYAGAWFIPLPSGNSFTTTVQGVPVTLHRQNPNPTGPFLASEQEDTYWVDYEWKLGPGSAFEWFGHAFYRYVRNGAIFLGSTSDHRFLTMGGTPQCKQQVFAWSLGAIAAPEFGGPALVHDVQDLSVKAFGVPLPVPAGISNFESLDAGTAQLIVTPGHIRAEAAIPSGPDAAGARADVEIHSTFGWQSILQSRLVTPLGDPADTTSLIKVGTKLDIKPSVGFGVGEVPDESVDDDNLAQLVAGWSDTAVGEAPRAVSWYSNLRFFGLLGNPVLDLTDKHWGVISRCDVVDAWIPTKSWQLRTDFDTAAEELEDDETKLPITIAIAKPYLEAGSNPVADIPYLRLSLPSEKGITLGSWTVTTGTGSVSASTLTSTGTGTVFASTATYTSFYPYRWLRLEIDSDDAVTVTVRLIQEKIDDDDPLPGTVGTEFVKTYSIDVVPDTQEYWIDTLDPIDEVFEDVLADGLNAAVYAHYKWVLASRFTGIGSLHRLELEFSNSEVTIGDVEAVCRYRARLRCGGTSRYTAVLPATGESQNQPFNMWIGEVDGRDAFRLGPPSEFQLTLRDNDSSDGWLDIEFWNASTSTWDPTGVAFAQYNWINQAGAAIQEIDLLAGGILYRRGATPNEGQATAPTGEKLIEFNNHLMGWYYGSPQVILCEQVFGHAVGATVVPGRSNRMVAATVDDAERFPFATDNLGYGRRAVHWYPSTIPPFDWIDEAPEEDDYHFLITGASESFPTAPDRSLLYHGGHNWGAFEFGAFESVDEDQAGGIHSCYDPWRKVRYSVQFGDLGLIVRRWSEIRPLQEFVIHTEPCLSAQIAWHHWGHLYICYEAAGSVILIRSNGNEESWSSPMTIDTAQTCAIAVHPLRGWLATALFDAGTWKCFRRKGPSGTLEEVGTILTGAPEAAAGLVWHTALGDRLIWEGVNGDGNAVLMQSHDFGGNWEAVS